MDELARTKAILAEIELGLADLCKHLGLEPPAGLHPADVLEKYICRELENRGVI